MKYLIGQRVLLNGDEIGVVEAPQRSDLPNTDKEMWVYSPSRGYSSLYAIHNIKPLPNNAL